MATGKQAESTELMEEARALHIGMRNLHLRLAALMQNRLLKGELTIPQWQALSVLYDNGPLAMNALATELGMPRPTATHLVDRLVTAELVSRQGDPADRRVVQAVLTGKGREVIEEIRDEFARLLVLALQCLEPERRQALREVIEQFNRMLEAAGGECG